MKTVGSQIKNKRTLKVEKAILQFLAQNIEVGKLRPQRIKVKRSEVSQPPLLAGIAHWNDFVWSDLELIWCVLFKGTSQ